MIPVRERRTFDAFVDRSSDRLLRTAYLLCGDRGHAEDLVQTALMRTARRWRTARENPEAYARRVVVNLSKDRWRELSRRPAEAPLETDVSLPEQTALLDRDELLRAARWLPEGQRTVLVLRYFDDLSVEEAATGHAEPAPFPQAGATSPAGPASDPPAPPALVEDTLELAGYRFTFQRAAGAAAPV